MRATGLGVAALVVLVCGCGPENEMDAVLAKTAPLAADGSRLVKGRRFDRIGKQGESLRDFAATLRPSTDESPEAIADNNRAVMIMPDGNVYYDRDARAPTMQQWEQARRAMRAAKEQPPGTVIMKPGTMRVETMSGGAERAGIFGADNRTQPADTTPWGLLQQLALQTSDGRCTATLIDLNTAVTAAHCFWNENTAAVANFAWVRPGAHNGAATHGHYPCWYATWFPGGYVNNQNSTYYDFAVIDFAGCPSKPSDVAGALGWWQWGDYWLGPTSFYSYGYPTFCGGAAPGTAVTWPSLCGSPSSGGALRDTTLSPHEFYSENVDVSRGMSGGAMYIDDSGSKWAIGFLSQVVTQYNWFFGFTGGWRVAKWRVLDGYVMNFLAAYTTDF